VSTKLLIYNNALVKIGERALSALTEERAPRRHLDTIWDNGAVDFCLEQAQWYFAMRAVLADYDPSIEPAFGYRRAFQKPSDWIVTSALCSDEYFTTPITQYLDEAGYWYCDYDIIYVKYVSNDSSYGGDMGKWPATFAEYVSTYLAGEILLSMTQDFNKYAEYQKGAVKEALLTAKNKAAMAEPTMFPAQGNWSKSRGASGNRERGNRNSLFG
jgi:hypothetical protein